jgi:chromosome segregation ATPase
MVGPYGNKVGRHERGNGNRRSRADALLEELRQLRAVVEANGERGNEYDAMRGTRPKGKFMSTQQRYESDGEYVSRLESELDDAKRELEDTERELKARRERVMHLEAELREMDKYYEDEARSK